MAKKIRRADFSDSLVHLTRDRRVYSDWDLEREEDRKLLSETPAFDVLKEILTSGVIRGSGNDGFVKGHRTAVCFSEIPLASMHLFARPPGVPFDSPESSARYRFYGIVISKRAVFEAGGRPVIYLPDSEGTWIPPEEKWRHVRFDGRVDFTHEREWRVPGDLDMKALNGGMYVIVWSAAEERELQKFKTPLGGKILSIIPMEHITGML